MAQVKTENKNRSRFGFFRGKHGYIFKLILATLIFIIILICVRVFLLNKTVFRDKTGEDSFEAPLQSEVSEEKVRVTKNRNIARAEFVRFPNFQDPREIVSDGDFLWIATGNGLIKYHRDKKDIVKIYTEADGLPDNILTSLVKYKDKIFLGTQGGLSIFDPQKETFVNYLDKEEWKYNNNLDHFFIREHNLWMSTFGGLRRYDIESNKWYNFSYTDVSLTAGKDSLFFTKTNIAENSKVFEVPTRASDPNDISISLEDSGCRFDDVEANEFWVLALCNLPEVAGSRIFKLKAEEDQWEEIPGLTLDQDQYYAFGGMHLVDDKVFLNEIGDNGSVLFVSYDLKTEEKTYLDLPSEIQDQIAQPIAFLDDLIWFGGDRDLFSYNSTSGESVSFREEQDFPAVIVSILAQKEDLVLANTDLGVGLIDFEARQFKVIDQSVKNHASGVFQGDDIWFLSYDLEMGVYNIDLVHYNLAEETKETWEIEDNSELASQLILAEDRKLWIISSRILLYDVDTKKLETFDDFPEEINHLLSDIKSRLFGSKIWFGFAKPYGEQGGLGSFDLLEKQYSFISLPQGYNITPHGGIVVSNLDDVYFAPPDYKGKGIYVYDRNTKGVRTINTNSSQIEQNGVMLFDYRDNLLALRVKGKIPVARVGRSIDSSLEQYYQTGLSIHDPDSNQWYFFDTEQGLIDNEVLDVLIGDRYIYILAGGVTVMDKDF